MANANTISITHTYPIGGDLTVNRMGYGAMRITGDGIWGPLQDREEAIRILQKRWNCASKVKHQEENIKADALSLTPEDITEPNKIDAALVSGN